MKIANSSVNNLPPCCLPTAWILQHWPLWLQEHTDWKSNVSALKFVRHAEKNLASNGIGWHQNSCSLFVVDHVQSFEIWFAPWKASQVSWAVQSHKFCKDDATSAVSGMSSSERESEKVLESQVVRSFPELTWPPDQLCSLPQVAALQVPNETACLCCCFAPNPPPLKSREMWSLTTLMICFICQSSKINNVTYSSTSEDDCRWISKTCKRQRMLKDEIELCYMLVDWKIYSPMFLWSNLSFTMHLSGGSVNSAKDCIAHTCESNLQQGSKESGRSRWGILNR